MDILYYITSYFRILPRKTVQLCINYYNGLKSTPATRMIQQPMTIKMWNHVSNLYLEPTLILSGIYLGNAYNASNYLVLSKLKIKTIVNVSRELPNFFENNSDIVYLQIPVKDDAEHHLTDFIRSTIDFLDKYGPYDEDNCLLVHCYMGSSRSASIILIYLIYKYNFTYDAALSLLRQKRPIVNINTNFLKDIQEYYYNEPLII